MADEQAISIQLDRLQNNIAQRIINVRNLLHQQDHVIVQQIIMRKSHSSDPIYPKYDRKLCYYQQFWKIYLLNEIMITKIQDYSINNKQVIKQVIILQDNQKQWSQIMTQRSKKKIRRTSDMIEKSYQCPFQKCNKNYGSDVSLNLHMKLKHNSGTKTQRQTLAKQICLAQQKGQKIKDGLCFPPGYLEEFRESFRRENL